MFNKVPGFKSLNRNSLRDATNAVRNRVVEWGASRVQRKVEELIASVEAVTRTRQAKLDKLASEIYALDLELEGYAIDLEASTPNSIRGKAIRRVRTLGLGVANRLRDRAQEYYCKKQAQLDAWNAKFSDMFDGSGHGSYDVGKQIHEHFDRHTEEMHDIVANAFEGDWMDEGVARMRDEFIDSLSTGSDHGAN